MSRSRLLIVLSFLVLTVTLSSARANTPAEDPVSARVERAEAEYDRAAKRARDNVLAKLDREVEAARKSKQADRLGRADLERKEFLDKGEVPKSVGVTSFGREMLRAGRALAAAYARAVEEYRTADKADDADVIAQRLEQLQLNLDAVAAAEKSGSDPFPEGSVWAGSLRVKPGRGRQHERGAHVTVSRRDRDRFEARVTMTDPRVVMVVDGRVNGKVVAWNTSGAKIEAGGIGRQAFSGRISDQRLEIVLSGTTREGKAITGSGTLFRDVQE